MASEAYHHSLSKKKQYEFVDRGEKLISLDALGAVMIVDGEKFGENSTFGTILLLLVSSNTTSYSNSIGSSLVKLGRAHCKIATLQEAYTVTFKDTFITALQQFEDSIKEYELLKKKLESRRYGVSFSFPRVPCLIEF
jgi:hypothetical protein